MATRTTQVMFYLLDDNDLESETSEGSLLYHACMQASYFYRQKQKVFIYTDNQTSAHQLDEMLWAFDAKSFVPHNLQGEGPSYGSAVEISWQAPSGRRPILINVSKNMPDFSHQFSQIVDFVPSDESLKQQARERFKAYRQSGFEVGNQAVSTP